MTDKELLELGVEDAFAREAILQMLEEKETNLLKAQQALEMALAELSAVKKQSALEKSILAAGGKNTKAILALLDMEHISLDDNGNLEGLDLQAVKAEAPYLFYEAEEKKKGTGISKAASLKKQDEMRAAFWGMK